jgi:hypothetical protein
MSWKVEAFITRTYYWTISDPRFLLCLYVMGVYHIDTSMVTRILDYTAPGQL